MIERVRKLFQNLNRSVLEVLEPIVWNRANTLNMGSQPMALRAWDMLGRFNTPNPTELKLSMSSSKFSLFPHSDLTGIDFSPFVVLAAASLLLTLHTSTAEFSAIRGCTGHSSGKTSLNSN